MRSALQSWRSPGATKTAAPEQHLLDANQNLRDLIEDTEIPASVRAELSEEFEEISAISEKLRNGEIHIAVFGRVGVGKSSLLNALLHRQAFSTSPLHGQTVSEDRAEWRSFRDGNVVLIDTPGIDELGGHERDQLARRVSQRSDIVMMLCEADLTDSEFRALEGLCNTSRTVLLVLNKADHFTRGELDLLLQRLRERCSHLLEPGRILHTSANPLPETLITIDESGKETESQRQREPDTQEVTTVLWTLIESQGQALAALNAAVFASELDEKVATRIVAARKSAAEKIIRNYCVGKGLLVAANPVPVTDLLAAAGVDIAMVIHLGEIYGFRLSRREASRLLLTISAQMVALMGAYWGMNLVSSAMKTASAGLSTALTAVSQGALAWYATSLTGKMAQTGFSKGKSWGRNGPKDTARNILASLDRDSIIKTARNDLQSRLRRR